MPRSRLGPLADCDGYVSLVKSGVGQMLRRETSCFVLDVHVISAIFKDETV
jgi:hypothetical protein